MRIGSYITSDIGEKLRERINLPALLRPLLMVSGAILLWILSLQNVNLNRMTDLGLVSVLPLSYYAALLVLTISFALSVHEQQTREPVLLLHVLTLIFIIHGTPQILYGTLRYSWAWKHVGIVDYIQRHGSVNPNIGFLSAYHDWPGFFALSAFFTEVAGFQSALSFAGWGPVFFNAIDLGALLMIYHSLTKDQRLIWLGVWFFYLTSWIGQDYFSPQAMSYFLYLVTLGILLSWFRVQTPPSRLEIKRWLRFEGITSLVHTAIQKAIPGDTQESGSTPLQRMTFMGMLILTAFVIASSHQLTPLMAISALTFLIVFQIITTRSLPVLIAVFTVTWIIYMAVGFLNGNLEWVIKSIGLLAHNFDANLINLSKASPDQVFISIMDRSLSAMIWILAAFGLIRRYRRGYWDLPAVLLAFSPFPLLAANSYGGEMLFRVYYFGLPFIAFLAATLLYPHPAFGISWRTPVSAVLLSSMLLSGFMFAYYGKERMYYFSKNEVAAAEYLNSNAPPGSLIVDGSWDWPLQYRNYELYNYLSIANLEKGDRTLVMNDPVNTLSHWMDDIPSDSEVIAQGQKLNVGPSLAANPQDTDDYPAAYFILTTSQEAHIEMTGLMPAGSLKAIEQTLMQSGRYQVVFANKDATILKLTNPIEGEVK